MKWEMADTIFKSEGILPMWVADMDFKGPEAVREALHNRVEKGVFGYTGSADFLKEAVAGWLQRRHGWQVPKAWLTYSPGVISALDACVKCFTSPGDGIVIQPPVYPPFFSTVKENDRVLIQNPLKHVNGTYEMDLDDLCSKLASSRAKMLVLCSPHNPVGRVWPRETLEALARICIRHDLIVVSDEIHADLVFKSGGHTPFLTLFPELASRTVTCMAPSKTFNLAGLQTAFTIIPDDKLRQTFESQMRKAHQTLINPLSLIAADAAYRGGDGWLDECLAYIEANVTYLEEELKRRVPSIVVTRPEGTYLIWLDCRGLGLEGDELSAFMAKEARIAMNAGSAFGKEGAGFMRINLACPRAVVEEAVNRLEYAVKKRRESQ